MSKESLTAELSALYNANQIETLVGQEMSKQSAFPSLSHTTEYGSKSSGGDVDFGGGGCGEFRNGLPRIVDLCVEDKKRILQLINELANCKEEKEITSKELNSLKQTVSQLQKEIASFNERSVVQKEALALEVENLVSSRDNLTLEIENLQNCVRIQKNEIEKQVLTISSLKGEKKQQASRISEQEIKIKTLTESLNKKNEPKQVRNEAVQVPNTDNRKIPGLFYHHAEKPAPSQMKDNKVEGCAGDGGAHFLREPISSSANTDVGYFAVRLCPEQDSEAALVVYHPT